MKHEVGRIEMAETLVSQGPCHWIGYSFPGMGCFGTGLASTYSWVGPDEFNRVLIEDGTVNLSLRLPGDGSCASDFTSSMVQLGDPTPMLDRLKSDWDQVSGSYLIGTGFSANFDIGGSWGSFDWSLYCSASATYQGPLSPGPRQWDVSGYASWQVQWGAGSLGTGGIQLGNYAVADVDETQWLGDGERPRFPAGLDGVVGAFAGQTIYMTIGYFDGVYGYVSNVGWGERLYSSSNLNAEASSQYAGFFEVPYDFAEFDPRDVALRGGAIWQQGSADFSSLQSQYNGG